MDIVRIPRSLILAFLLGAVSPLVMNVALIEFVRVTGFPLATAVLHSGLFVEHSSFIGAMRTLNGLVLGALMAVLLGIPLAFVAKQRLLIHWFIFAIAALAASALWHLNHQWGIAGFLGQWSHPEMWLSLLGIGVVAALSSNLRARRGAEHVAP